MKELTQRIYKSLQHKGLSPKFERAGIYCILLDGQIVYIGKSENMLWRMAAHYAHMAHPKENKYQVLAQARAQGHKIWFDVLYYAKSADPDSTKEELGQTEGRYIRLHHPPLNYQIPTAEDWKRYKVNPSAKTISLQEISERGNGN